ncbi:MAG: hypothetical protein GY703_14090, partial [Gammaproteobacteria bacterium]|nr:hypothetical protein [Gammaproteobacteria bacterium]
FSDPGADSWTATVDYGNGAGPQPLLLNPDKSFTLSHVYVDDGFYTVTVVVIDDDGGSGSDTATIAVRDSITPPVRTVFDLSARAKSGKVDLVWTPVAGAQSYSVYRGTTAGGPYDVIATGHTCDYCAYADFGLTNDVTYHYVVTSMTNGTESLFSNEVNATPQERRRTR